MSRRPYLTVKSECASCSGTGLYSGMCERKGEAVICLDCDGTGCRKLVYHAYEGRKPKRGIKTIRLSRGKFIATGVGGAGETMTYEEFEKRIKPEKRD